MKRFAAGFCVLVVVVLAYGYWFGVTHGSVYITVLDVSDREHIRDLKSVHLSFRSAARTVLAEATGSEAQDAITISAPAPYSCQEIERRAMTAGDVGEDWADCFDRQSRWLAGWVWDVRSVDLEAASCNIDSLPLAVSEHPDTWWLWWVPLRHIGGKPYTSFGFEVRIHRDACG